MTGEAAMGAGGMQPHAAIVTTSSVPSTAWRASAVIWPRAEDFAVTHELRRRQPPHVRRRGVQRSETQPLLRLGEGVGGVAISTGTAKTKSWKSGAYAVELPESKAKLTVELEGEKYTSSSPTERTTSSST